MSVTLALWTGALARATDGIALDVYAAEEGIAFLADLAAGVVWDEARIREMVALPGFQAMISHHVRLDAEFAEEALVTVLVALAEGRTSVSDSHRILHIARAWEAAALQVAELRARLERLARPSLLEQAARRAAGALPSSCALSGTVHLVLDGRSPAYMVGSQVVIDLLQISGWDAAVAALGHELHHVGFYACMVAPPPGGEGVAQAWDLLASLIAEGSAQVLVDRCPCFASENDFQAVNRALEDALLGPVPSSTWATWLDALVAWPQPALYRVGCHLITRLVASYGRPWVVEHLPCPHVLLVAYHRLDPTTRLSLGPVVQKWAAQIEADYPCVNDAERR